MKKVNIQINSNDLIFGVEMEIFGGTLFSKAGILSDLENSSPDDSEESDKISEAKAGGNGFGTLFTGSGLRFSMVAGVIGF